MEYGLLTNKWDIALIFTDYETAFLARALRPQMIEAALERELKLYNQISVIESFIGMARYFAAQKYNLSVSQSRKAIDELKSYSDLSFQQHANY